MSGNGRIVFVTGGAHGIGRSIVKAFAENGYRVSFCDIDKETGEKTSMETGARFYHVDVRDAAALEKCIDHIQSAESRLDIVVNNVGIGMFKPLTELTVEEFDRVIATNLRPAFVTSRKFVINRAKHHVCGYGRIINICSTRYLQSEAGTEAYSASKGGIYSMTHALAMSAPPGVTVNAIAPGWIHVREDEIIRPEDDAFHPSGRVGVPDDVARICLFLCEEGNDFINGQTIVVDGGATIKMMYPE